MVTMIRPTILYDRDCGFCRWSLAKLLAWDRRARLRPVALQDPEAARLLAGMSEAERMGSWHLVGADGGVRSAGSALAPLLRELPWGRGPARLAAAAPVAVARAYRWIAGNRSPLGRLVSEGAKRRADARIARRLEG
jgi:predicted DCC family thiol-disulfide oxidoreductase YuxK